MVRSERRSKQYLLAIVAIVAIVAVVILLQLPSQTPVGKASSQTFYCIETDTNDPYVSEVSRVQGPNLDVPLPDQCFVTQTYGGVLVQRYCVSESVSDFSDIVGGLVADKFTLCDCTESMNACEPNSIRCTDDDLDKYYAGPGCPSGIPLDCDDDNELAHPSMAEICGDAKDNNCDGTVDEGCQVTSQKTVQLYYKGEGFKNDNTGQRDYEYVANTFSVFDTGAATSHIELLKNENPDIKVMRYIKFAGVKGPDLASQCCKNTGNGNDNCPNPSYPEYTLVEDAMEGDLFWYKDGGKVNNPPPHNNGWCFIDWLDQSKVDSWIDAMEYTVTSQEFMSNQFTDGFFLDNSMVPFAGYMGVIMPDGTQLDYNIEEDVEDADTYYTNIIHAVSEMRSRFPDAYIVVNGYNNRDASIHRRGLELLDAGASGIMRESFAFKTSNEKPWPRSRLVRTIEDAWDIVNGVGLKDGVPKDFVGMDYFTSVDSTDARIFSLSTYLLIANEHAYWSPVPGGLTASRSIYLPEFDLDLGTPLGGYVDDPSSGLLYRNYEKGTVIVNPDGLFDGWDPEGPDERLFDPGCSSCQVEMLTVNGGGMLGSTGSLDWVQVNLQNGNVAIPRNSAKIIRIA